MSASNLPACYDPKEVESKWYDRWESRGYFYAEASDATEPASQPTAAPTHPQRGDTYCITIPPPNVTGSLHMGHALNHSVQDLLIRWNRMRGKRTVCIPGTDHASIAVHAKLEEKLRGEGLTRHDLGREKFLERAWEWKAHYGGAIIRQLRRLGCSYDWRRERFTMDDHYTRAVQRVFVEWHRKGWIYRGYRIVNWCTNCRTSLSDLEAPMVEQPGKLWHIRYPLTAMSNSEHRMPNSEPIVVATTRPETMLGDTAVAVNPKDERYAHLVGKTVILPLMNRDIPIVADEMVDRSFGTGAVKVTPGHDANDFDLGQRHGLPLLLVIGKDAVMTSAAGAYAGLDRYAARARVVRDLEAQGFLVKVEDYPEAKVPCCARCDSVLEPLPLEQWFVNMQAMAARAIEAIAARRVRYVPQRYTHVALEWLRNIRDWNISRQLWWGQRIPAWLCSDCGKWTAQVETPTKCTHCASEQLKQDPDVFDTWFSSGIWPQTVLGWPDDTPELKMFFPTSLLSTGRDILHLWVARMIMSSLDFAPAAGGGGAIPFYDVYVHPTILNWEGKRMSKSLGTGVDPLDLIEEYGADATRFGLLYMCSTTQDVRFTEERIAMARNFCNKLWNAARFVLMNTSEPNRDRSYGSVGEGAESSRTLTSTAPLTDVRGSDLPSRWLLSRTARTCAAVNEALTSYDFDVAARALYEFIWNEFCDWYVELAKLTLRAPESQPATRNTLLTVLEGTLRLLHPFMPFVTEEIWQQVNGGVGEWESIMIAQCPQCDKSLIDAAAERDMALFMDTVRAVRNLRAEAGVATGKPVTAALLCHSEDARAVLETMAPHFASLDTRATVTFIGALDEKPAQSLSASVGDTELFLDTAGLVDLAAERQRLEKERDQLRDYVARLEARLADEKFTGRAPAPVVEAERVRCDEARQQLARVEGRLRDLSCWKA